MKLRKNYVILLPLVYDLGKVSRGSEMNGEIVYASLVRSTGFEQIYCRTCICLEQGQVNFEQIFIGTNYHRQNGPSSLILLNIFFDLKGS